jgi:hypothetical protein
MSASTRETFRIEEAHFKPIDGGWLFEAPNAWVFAPGRRYVVTEAQRSALLDIMRPRRPDVHVYRLVGAITTFAIGIILLWCLISGHKNPTTLDVVSVAAIIFVPVYLAAVVMIRRQLRRIAPILTAAVPTQAQSTVGQRYEAIATAIPAKVLVQGIVVFVLLAILQAVRIAALGKASASFLAPGSIWNLIMPLAGALGALFLLRIRRQRNGA